MKASDVVNESRKVLTQEERRIERTWNAYWASKYVIEYCDRSIAALRGILPNLHDPRSRRHIKRALAAVRRVRGGRVLYLRRVGVRGVTMPTSERERLARAGNANRIVHQYPPALSSHSHGAAVSEAQAANQRLK
jgi:hypothetical protein